MAEECPDCIHSLSEEMMAAKVKLKPHHEIFWTPESAVICSDFYFLYRVGKAKSKVLKEQLLAWKNLTLGVSQMVLSVAI